MQDPDIAGMQATVIAATFAVCVMLGALMQRSNFCTMGAIADIVNMGDWTRMRMWLAAIGVAIAGTQTLAWAGLIDPGKSFYTAPALTWLSHLVGGLMFGFGMVLASGCGSKTVLRIGGGSLKSLVVFLVMGLFAYMTMRGVFGVFRVGVLDKAALDLAHGQDLPRLLAAGNAAALPGLRLGLGLGLGAALIAFALAGRDFRRGEPIIGALGAGLAVVAVWAISGMLGYVAEAPDTLEEKFLGTNSGRLESLSFVAPVAYTLELVMLWSDRSRVLTLGIMSVLGLFAGSLMHALLTRQFRWEGFHGTEDTANHLVGGALMGVGGVTALGCTVGQGLSGISTLAVGSMLTLAAIMGGGWAALRYQMWRVERMD
jgi:uncharacterized membrane protein YedE/YeeE